jgi:hypothetical protein
MLLSMFLLYHLAKKFQAEKLHPCGDGFYSCDFGFACNFSIDVSDRGYVAGYFPFHFTLRWDIPAYLRTICLITFGIINFISCR